MQYFQLIAALLPVAQQIFQSIEAAIAAGRHPAVIHSTIMDHVGALPDKIRALAPPVSAEGSAPAAEFRQG